MPRVALDPAPAHLVLRGDLVEPLPEVHVLDGLLRGRLPAARLPRAQPLGDALLHVLRVGVELDAARALQRRECLDHGRELHAVVGGPGLAAEELALGAVAFEDGTPAPGTGVALARAVGVDDDGLYL